MIVAFILGVIFVFIGCRLYVNRDWKKDKIKEWLSEPQTIAKITGTTNKHDRDGNYDGYYYDAELLIDGKWHRAQSWDTFFKKMACEIGEEVIVAYRPIKDTKMQKIADSIMGVMVDAIMNDDWEEIKPQYHFKFIDEHKYDNEGQGSGTGAIFFIIFGSIVILMGVLSYFGVIA